MSQNKPISNESELLKIQIYADYCHTSFTFRSTLIVTALFGLLLVNIGLAYQGLLPLLAYYLLFPIIGIFFYYFLRQAFTEYHSNLDQIQDFFIKLAKNEPLPEFKDMRKGKK